MDVLEIIAAFGGTTKTAQRFGVLPSAVSNWKAKGRLPGRLHIRILQEAQKQGIKVPLSTFDDQNA